ncbi:hypothetical protein X975_12613, partial [Stegodyphus mimosarum]
MNTSAHNFESYPRSVDAIVLPNLGEAYNSLDYIRGVSAVIGTDHIHSIIETVNSVKIVLKNEEYVNWLIENGILVKGRFVSVDYAIPPGTEIILIDDDSSISNNEIMQELSKYCWIKSPIIHVTEFKEVEYSHIKNGKRKVYVEFAPGRELPSELKLMHNGTYHQIRVIVNENSETNSKTSSNNPVNRDDASSHIVLVKQEIVEVETPEETPMDEYLNITYSDGISPAQTSVCQIQDYVSCAAVPTDAKYRPERMAKRPQRTDSKNNQMLGQSGSNPIFSDNSSFDDKVQNFLKTVRFRRNVKELADRAVTQGDFQSLSHLLSELEKYSCHSDQATSMRINRIMQKLLDTEDEFATKNQ